MTAAAAERRTSPSCSKVHQPVSSFYNNTDLFCALNTQILLITTIVYRFILIFAQLFIYEMYFLIQATFSKPITSAANLSQTILKVI